MSNGKGGKDEGMSPRTKKLLFAAGALAVAVGIAIICFNIFGAQRTAKNTLEGYFKALYCDTLIREMQPYLVEAIRDQAYNDYTFFGQTVQIMRQLQIEKENIVGSDMTLSVKVTKEEAGTAAALNSAASAYGANAVMDVSYTVTFKGQLGSADYTGIARLVKIAGKWYLTEYSLPMEPVQ